MGTRTYLDLSRQKSVPSQETTCQLDHDYFLAVQVAELQIYGRSLGRLNNDAYSIELHGMKDRMPLK